MITPQDLQELYRYFQPRTETVTSLPDIRAVKDKSLVVLQVGSTQKLYIAEQGQWKLIATLS